MVAGAAQLVRAAFQLALKHDAGQRVRLVGGQHIGAKRFAQRLDERRRIARKVARLDAHHQARIGVAFVAAVLAHTVGHHAARLAGGRDHSAAGAHAKAVDGAAVRCVVHQLVIGRAQQRVAGVAAPARAVDHALRVLDAHPNRERLGHHVDAAPVQRLEGVARRVAERQHGVARRQLVAFAVLKVFDRQCLQDKRGQLIFK